MENPTREELLGHYQLDSLSSDPHIESNQRFLRPLRGN